MTKKIAEQRFCTIFARKNTISIRIILESRHKTICSSTLIKQKWTQVSKMSMHLIRLQHKQT